MKLLRNWHLMRLIRLAFALFLTFQAIETQQWFFLIFAAFFLLQAIFNLGCTTNSCSIPLKDNKND